MNTTATHRIPASARALLLGVAGLCLSMAAQAGESARYGASVTRVVVNYGDLNLASPQGARTMYARLRSAASQACGARPGTRDLQESSNYTACYNQALDKAVRKLDNARLQALHARQHAGSAVG